MKIIENRLLFEYFLLTLCGLQVTHEQVYMKPYTIWGNQNNHSDRLDLLMESRSKRSLFDCGVHGQEPTIDSMSAETTLPGEWPWVVALVRSRDKVFEFQCSATLIDNRFAITAAHCLYSTYHDQKKLEIGEIAIIDGARDVQRKIYDADSARLVTAIYVHEEFYLSSNTNDIALLVLKEPVPYSKLVRPVCMWEGEDDQDDLEKAFHYGTVIGWQDLAPQGFNISIISGTNCQNLSRIGVSADIINGKTFCTAKEGNTGICGHHKGAGLYIKQHGRWRLRGVVSTTIFNWCGFTAFCTDVAKYRNWISDTAYRWLQTNILPAATWTQQCSMRGEVNTLVTGGQTTKEGEWPWHVAIYHNEHIGSSSLNRYKCGGSLISANHVLTAAHCIIDKLTNRPIEKSSINILLGTHNIKALSVGVQLKLVDRLETHPEYNPQTQYKDIALLRLSSPAEFTAAVRPVCLWPEDKVDVNSVEGKKGSVVGWGNDEFGLLADELMLAELPVVSELTCIRSHNIFYLKYTNNFTFCAGLLKDTSVCNGDSGGGMVFKLRSSAGTEWWFLRGLVSLRLATDKPCDPSQYVIFTDVAKYLDWIKDFISRTYDLNS